jgi:myo-inositol 2-dehydrogenase/D-chiro-inositol 1-dehydrogenase
MKPIRPAPPSLPRRSFLARSSAALAAFAAPAIVPSRVLGARSPGNRIHVGLVGMGRQMTKPNLPQLLGLPDVHLVAVCDVDTWRLDEARRAVEAHYGEQAGKDEWRGCTAHRDFREVLARADVDAVMIATPDHWHVPIAIEAVKAGKHVSVEKPLSISVAEGRALCEAVARAGVVSRTDSEFRSLRPFARAVELVRNGRIGKLHTIRTGLPVDTPGIPSQPDMPVPPELDYEKWLGPAPEAPYTEKRVHGRHDLVSRPNWMRISDYADGMIANWGTHLNDIAQWANDSEATGPVEVEAEGEFTKGLWNTVLRFEARYRYANGVSLVCRSDTPYIRFEGEEGWIRVDYPSAITAEPASVLGSVIASGELRLAEQLEDKADFVRAIKDGTKTLEPVEVGHRTVSICQIGLIAMEVGGKLRWDPERERFPDDNAANARLTRPQRDWRRAYGG